MEMTLQELSGDLWTGRIYQWQKLKKHFSDEVVLICVMRYSPRYINLKKNGILHFPELSPSTNTLRYYKENPQELEEDLLFYEFLKRFVKEIRNNNKVDDLRMEIRRSLQKGDTVILLCHEPAGDDCHRQALPYLLFTEEERAVCYRGEFSFGSKYEQKILDW